MGLITIEEMKSLRDIGKRTDDDKLNEAIELCEYGELYDLFGDFAQDIVANQADPGYADLMDGSTFTDSQSKQWTHKGVKAMFADLVYARYMRMINVNLTPFGATAKRDDNSVPIEESKLKELASQSRKDANSKFLIIRKYLEANKSTFTRFFDGDNPDLGQGQTRISVI